MLLTLCFRPQTPNDPFISLLVYLVSSYMNLPQKFWTLLKKLKIKAMHKIETLSVMKSSLSRSLC